MRKGLLAFFLGLLFGPLGMLYSTVFGAMVMAMAAGAVWVSAATPRVIPLLFPVCAVWALVSSLRRRQPPGPPDMPPVYSRRGTGAITGLPQFPDTGRITGGWESGIHHGEERRSSETERSL